MPTAEIPAFLQDFISHRKHVKGKESTPELKKKLGLSDKRGKAELDMAIEGIIEKKPNKKVVKEYFENRIKELSAEKMK
jgi:hypothetical protein